VPRRDKRRASAPAPFRRQLARIGPKPLAGIARRNFQWAQHRSGCQGEAGFHHGGIHIAATGNAAAKPALESVMAFNPAGDFLALHQPGQHCRRRRAAIAPCWVTTASLSPRRGGDAGKPDDPIPKTKGFAIKDTNLRGFSRDRAIRRRRAKQIGRQAETKEQRRNHRASDTKPRAAEAGT